MPWQFINFIGFVCFLFSAPVRGEVCYVSFANHEEKIIKPSVRELLTWAKSPHSTIREQSAHLARTKRGSSGIKILDILKTDAESEVRKEVVVSASYKVLQGGQDILFFLAKDSDPYVSALARSALNNYKTQLQSFGKKIKQVQEFQKMIGSFVEDMASVKWLESWEHLRSKMPNMPPSSLGKNVSSILAADFYKKLRKINADVMWELMEGSVTAKMSAIYFYLQIFSNTKLHSLLADGAFPRFIARIFISESDIFVKISLIDLLKLIEHKDSWVLSVIYDSQKANEHPAVQETVYEFFKELGRTHPFALPQNIKKDLIIKNAGNVASPLLPPQNLRYKNIRKFLTNDP